MGSEVIVPLKGEGISMTALSVITSASVWPDLTVSPTFTAQAPNSASYTPSPNSGNRNSIPGSFHEAKSARSGGFRRQRVKRRLDAGKLRDGILLVNLIEADAGDVLPHQDPGADQQIVEMLFDHASKEMLTKVRDFRIFIHNQDASGLLHALTDRLPVVRKEAPQVENVASESRFLAHLIDSLHAEGQRSSVTHDRDVISFTHPRRNPQGDDVLFQIGPARHPLGAIPYGSVDHLLEQILVGRFSRQ